MLKVSLFTRQATWYAFAAIRQDGSTVTWGASFSGGDSAHVQGQLVDVQEIQATHNAFAAIVGPERRVVSWGAANAGGDCISMLVGCGHQQPLKGSRFQHPKKGTSRIARDRFFF